EQAAVVLSRECSTHRLSWSAYLICPRISPAGDISECTLAYALPSRIASITSPISPALTPWVGTATTSAAVNVPVTVPACGPGQAGVPGGGVGVVTLEQKNSTMPPLTLRCPMWIWAWVTVPSRPL